MKNFGIAFVSIAVLAGLWFAINWFGLIGGPLAPGENRFFGGQSIEVSDVSFVVEEYASGLSVPWSMVFTANTRMLVSERPGRIRVIENGVLSPKPLHTFGEVSVGGEEGLMSLAVDPDYSRNITIFASLAYKTGDQMFVKIVKFRDEGTSVSMIVTILDKIPAAQFHAGSRIKFGPDGKLYITTGDATDKKLAQDLKSLAGKILRINKDGTIPDDNPFPGSPVWSYGSRNPQGIDWHPENHELYETEHGPSVFDGPAGGDEVNRIVKGANYGWPLVSHLSKLAGTVSPLVVHTPAEAPASLMIYSGKVFPQFRNDLFYGCLVGEGLMHLKLDETNPDAALGYEKLAEVKFGRIRDVTEGPDGLIYFSTSNRDGRGRPAENDDRIFRIRPH